MLRTLRDLTRGADLINDWRAEVSDRRRYRARPVGSRSGARRVEPGGRQGQGSYAHWRMSSTHALSTRGPSPSPSLPTRTPSHTLWDLAADGNWRVRHAVAANPSTPTDLLELLATDDHVVVRLGVADNAQAIAVYIALNSDDHETRKRVVHRHDLTAEIWQKLLTDPDYRVRAEIPLACPDPAIIAVLARDIHPQVRASTVHSRQLTTADAEVLATDRIATVRAAAACSHKLRPETLILLACDRYAQVRWCVLVYNPERTDLAAIIDAQDPDQMNAGQANAQLTWLKDV